MSEILRASNAAVEVAVLLNAQLATAIDLHTQGKQAHWNVRGSGFIGLHELFDSISSDVEGWSDLLAERTGALGPCAEGGLAAVSRGGALPAYGLRLADGEAHVERLSQALSLFADSSRAGIDRSLALGDAVTADVLAGITREADAVHWKVSAHRSPQQGSPS